MFFVGGVKFQRSKCHSLTSSQVVGEHKQNIEMSSLIHISTRVKWDRFYSWGCVLQFQMCLSKPCSGVCQHKVIPSINQQK